MSAKRVELKVKLFAQSQRMSCWLAAYRMMLQFRGKPYSDGAIDAAFKKGGLNFTDCKNKGLDGPMFPKARAALGLISRGFPFGYGSAEQGASQVLVSFLRDQGPLWVAGSWTGFNHINVIAGADAERHMLLAVDPWNDGITAEEPIWVDFDKYVQKVHKNIDGGVQHW